MGVAGIAAAIGAAAAVASTAYAMSQGAPNLNQGNAQEAGILEQAALLPWQRAYQSAADQGGTILGYGYTQTTAGDQQRAQLQQQLAQVQQQMQQESGYNVYTGTQGNQTMAYQLLQRQAQQLQQQIQNTPAGGGTVYLNSQGQPVPASQALVSFAGMGQGQVAAQEAQQMARVQLQLQQQFGVPFAEQARQELAQSDPQGTAARNELYNLVQQQNQAPFDQPVADLLDSQVKQQLDAGSGLDPTAKAMLDKEIASRGGDPNASESMYAYPLTSGFEGQQRALAGEQKATGWLASGSTPEDVQYRHEQQNLANLSAFVNGQTPEAQFQNLSSQGSQQGTTPFYPGQSLPQGTQNAAQNALGYTTAGWLQNMQYQQTQANGWMSGLSGLLGLGGALGRMGYQPFGAGGTTVPTTTSG